MLNLHEVCKGIFPGHVINHILSFRQTHPNAELIREHHRQIRDRVRQFAELTPGETFMELSTYECHFRSTVFAKYINFYLEETDYNYEEMKQYSRPVVVDYDAIYVFYGGINCSIIDVDIYKIKDIWRW